MQNKESKKKSEVLLNCPFCGGEASLTKKNRIIVEGKTERECHVHCNKCNARAERVLYKSCSTTEMAHELARKLWNTRKPMERIEQWRDIAGYEGIYQISDFGNVKSLDRVSVKEGRDYRVKEKVLKTFLCSSGYPTVVLSKNGKKETFMVHRLVALHFIPNPNNYEQINHKDENKNNNNVDNLEWCTQDYNLHYGNRGKKISEARRRKNKEEGGIE